MERYIYWQISKVIRSICLVRLSALGDVLMMVPLVRTLQDYFPEAKITWVISRPAYDLVAEMEGIEFIVIPKPNSVMDYWRFKKLMKGRHFDVLLATQASFRANLLYGLISATRKIGYDALRAKDGHGWFIHETIAPGRDHTLEGFLKFAEPLGVTTPVVRWDLPLSEEALVFADEYLSRFKPPMVLINPAASKPERSWNVARYVAIIKHLQHRWNAHVILTGGPSLFDRTLGKAITKEVLVHDLIGQTKPNQLLALIAQSDLLICPDTGPSHMAAAVGTPVIALHAVTSAQVSGPYTYRHLAVDYYPQAVELILNKTWETMVWGTHAHGDKTMDLVCVESVIEMIDSVMEGMNETSL